MRNRWFHPMGDGSVGARRRSETFFGEICIEGLFGGIARKPFSVMAPKSNGSVPHRNGFGWTPLNFGLCLKCCGARLRHVVNRIRPYISVMSMDSLLPNRPERINEVPICSVESRNA